MKTIAQMLLPVLQVAQMKLDKTRGNPENSGYEYFYALMCHQKVKRTQKEFISSIYKKNLFLTMQFIMGFSQ